MAIDLEIYRFNVSNLMYCGKYDEQKKKLTCNSNDSLLCLCEHKLNGDSLFLYQTRKEFPNIPLYKIYAIFDFSELDDIKPFNQIKKFENGFEVYIDNEQITFVPFIKSNSMSKESKVIYINDKYKDKLNERITFNFDKLPKLDLSKWFSYVGLSATSGKVLDNLKIDMDRVVVIDDYVVSNNNISCITALSTRLINSDCASILNSIKELDIDKNELLNKDFSSLNKKYIDVYTFLNNYRSYQKSNDFVKLPKQIQDAINKINSSNSNDELIDVLRNINISDKGFQSNETKWYKIYVENYVSEINMYDGEGFITFDLAKNICKEIKKVTDNYSFQIRLPFIKGVVHACDFKKFLSDKYKVFKIKGKTYGKGEESYRFYDIDKVDMIITESMFKASKYLKQFKKQPNYKELLTIDNEELSTPLDYYKYIFKKYDFKLLIAHTEYEFNNDNHLNYQFLSTIPFSVKSSKCEQYLQNTINEIRKGYDCDLYNIESSKVLEENGNDLDKQLFNNKESRLFYVRTKRYDKFRNFKRDSLLKNAIQGELRISGFRRILCGDLLGLLYHCLNNSEKYNSDTKFINMPSEEQLKKNTFFAPFDDEEKNVDYQGNYLILRNPHYSRNEICIEKRYIDTNSDRFAYFNHLKGVIMINPLNMDAEKLGGADYDGDSVLIVKDSFLTGEALDLFTKTNEKVNREYAYPAIHIPSLGSDSVALNYNNIINCFFNTFSSRTGKISNEAFKVALLNYDDTINSGLEEKLDEVAFYSILGGLEIDSAKNGLKPHIEFKKKLECNF